MSVVYLQRWLQLFPFLCSPFFAILWLSKNWRSLASLLHQGWPCDLILLTDWWKHVLILRSKETLHASALCRGILTSQHVKPRLTCWRMREQVAQASAWPQPTQKLSRAADGSSPQTHDGARLTLEEPPNWAQSECQPTELRAEGRFGVLLSHWLLECLLHIQSFECRWYSVPHRVARRVWKAPSAEPGAPKSYDWFRSLLLPP